MSHRLNKLRYDQTMQFYTVMEKKINQIYIICYGTISKIH